MSFVTFIIPTIARESIKDSINSLFAQTDSDWEAIIIFDGVQPNVSYEDKRIRSIIIDKCGETSYNRIHGLISHAGRVRNQGFKLANSKWIGFLDDDDTLSEDYVEKLKQEDDGSCTFVLFRMQADKIIPDPSINEIIINEVGISFAVRKDIVDKYNLEFQNDGSEDWKFANNIVCLELPYKISKHLTYYTHDN